VRERGAPWPYFGARASGSGGACAGGVAGGEGPRRLTWKRRRRQGATAAPRRTAAPLRRTSAVRRTAVRLRRCTAVPHRTAAAAAAPPRCACKERRGLTCMCACEHTYTRLGVYRMCAVCGPTVARRVGLGPHEALHTCQSNSAKDYVLYAIGTVVVAIKRDPEDLGSPSNSRNTANSVS
jgi:hypothetical protein